MVGMRASRGNNNNNNNHPRTAAALVNAAPADHQVVATALTSNSTSSTSISSRQEWARAVAPSGPMSPRMPPPPPPSPHRSDADVAAALTTAGPGSSNSSSDSTSGGHTASLPLIQQQQQKQCVIINPPILHRQHSRDGTQAEPFSPRSAGAADGSKPQLSSPYNRLISSSQGEAVVSSFKEILRAVQSTIPKVESALATCHGGAGGDFDDFFSFHNYDANSVEEEEELQQMRRLGSWSTVETMATSTSTSTLTADLALSYSAHAASDTGGMPSIRDDDGHLIDPLLLEMRRKAKIESRKVAAAAAASAAETSADAATDSARSDRAGRSSAKKAAHASKPPRRRRVVQFEYPPVSSLRQCPRVDPGDLPSLFFTEEELEVFEHDRESTYTADDIEIVAISSGSSPAATSTSRRGSGAGGGAAGAGESDDDGTNRESDQQTREPPSGHSSHPHPPSSPLMNRTSSSSGHGFAGLGNYISTPRVIWNKKRQQQLQNGQNQRDEMALRSSSTAGKGLLGSPTASGSRAAASTAARMTPSSSPGDSTAKAPRQERLIKSVQIFLRERSAG
jgi:hypothetical protein